MSGHVPAAHGVAVVDHREQEAFMQADGVLKSYGVTYKRTRRGTPAGETTAVVLQFDQDLTDDLEELERTGKVRVTIQPVPNPQNTLPE
jgi:hypothetical protein